MKENEMIKIFKLMSGEEIVGETELLDDYYVIKLPMKVFMAVGENNQPQNRTEPFGIHCKGSVVNIPKDKVIYIADPALALQEFYEKTYLSKVPAPGVQDPNKDIPTFKLSEKEVEAVE